MSLLCGNARDITTHLTVEHNKQGEEGAGRAKEGQHWLLVGNRTQNWQR